MPLTEQQIEKIYTAIGHSQSIIEKRADGEDWITITISEAEQAVWDYGISAIASFFKAGKYVSPLTAFLSLMNPTPMGDGSLHPETIPYNTYITGQDLLNLISPGNQSKYKLFEGAKHGNPEWVEKALNQGADVNAIDSSTHNFTPLHWAAMNAHTEVIKLLASRGANLNARDTALNWTPLMQAAKNNSHAAAIQSLIRLGTDVYAKDINGHTAHDIAQNNNQITHAYFTANNQKLIEGAKHGNPEWVEKALNEGADVNAIDSSTHNFTPLHWAAMNAHTEVIKLLASRGANLNARDTALNWTPLMQAAKNNSHAAAIQSLIRLGADVYAKDINRHTAHDIAQANNPGVAPCVQAALQQKTYYQDQMLQAVKANDVDKMMALLNEHKGISHSIDTTYYNFTPLHIAALKGNTDAVRLLLLDGAPVDAPDINGWATLYQLAWNNTENMEIVEMLLVSGARLDQGNHEQLTPLHLAAMRGNAAMTHLLLEYNANPNARDKNAWTPGHQAAKNGHEDTLILLLAGGANPNLEDINRHTLLDVAQDCHCPNQEIKQLLSSIGGIAMRPRLAAEAEQRRQQKATAKAFYRVHFQEQIQQQIMTAATNSHNEMIAKLHQQVINQIERGTQRLCSIEPLNQSCTRVDTKAYCEEFKKHSIKKIESLKRYENYNNSKSSSNSSCSFFRGGSHQSGGRSSSNNTHTNHLSKSKSACNNITVNLSNSFYSTPVGLNSSVNCVSKSISINACGKNYNHSTTNCVLQEGGRNSSTLN